MPSAPSFRLPISFIQIITFGSHNEFMRDHFGPGQSPFSPIQTSPATTKPLLTCESSEASQGPARVYR